MACSLLSIALAVFCAIQYVSACDEKLIEKVKELKALTGPADIEKIKGNYTFVTIGIEGDDDLSDICLSAGFTGDSVAFTGFTDGEYKTKYEDDKMILSNDDGTTAWVVYFVGITDDGIAFVACSPIDVESEESFPFSGIAVRDEKGLEEAPKELSDKMAELEIKGSNIDPCE